MFITQNEFSRILEQKGNIFEQNVSAVDIRLSNGGYIHFTEAKALIIERLAYQDFNLQVFNETSNVQIILKIKSIVDISIIKL